MVPPPHPSDDQSIDRSIDLSGSSKRKAPEPQEVKLAAAAPAVTGAGDAIVEAPAAKAPKIEEVGVRWRMG